MVYIRSGMFTFSIRRESGEATPLKSDDHCRIVDHTRQKTEIVGWLLARSAGFRTSSGRLGKGLVILGGALSLRYAGRKETERAPLRTAVPRPVG